MYLYDCICIVRKSLINKHARTQTNARTYHQMNRIHVMLPQAEIQAIQFRKRQKWFGNFQDIISQVTDDSLRAV